MKYISLESTFWERQAHLQNLPDRRRKPRVNYSVVDAQKAERRITGELRKEQRRMRAKAKAESMRRKRKQEKEERMEMKRKEAIERTITPHAFAMTGRKILNGLTKMKHSFEEPGVRSVLYAPSPKKHQLPRLEWALQLKKAAIKCTEYGCQFGISGDTMMYIKFMRLYKGIENMVDQGPC